MTDKPESISPELLTVLQQAQACLDASAAMAIKQFTVANIFRIYGLQQGDTVDGQTGTITYAKADPPKSQPA